MKVLEKLWQLPTEIFKVTSDLVGSIPKNEKDLKAQLEVLKTVFEEETEKTKTMWETYNSAVYGLATHDDIQRANDHLKELIKTTGFSFMMIIPGSILALPYLIQIAKDNGVDIVPAVVKKQFEKGPKKGI